MTELSGEELVVAARAVATIAHSGQVDKIGNAYIGHPSRVAERLNQSYGDQAVAWLHDVLEDTDVTPEMLKDVGIPASVIADVELLTRDPHEQPSDYYDRIRQSSRARRVKLADIADNSNVDRLSQITDDATVARLVRKYAKARAFLGVGTDGVS